jgi:GAF domain-containing protein
MVLEKLIDRIMRAAIEHAGAERGLVISPPGDELQIQAEATISGEGITVHMRSAGDTAAALPESVVRYVTRTRDNLILEDASSGNPFSADPYFVQHRARSILCLPLINQAKLQWVTFWQSATIQQIPDPVT